MAITAVLYATKENLKEKYRPQKTLDKGLDFVKLKWKHGLSTFESFVFHTTNTKRKMCVLLNKRTNDYSEYDK